MQKPVWLECSGQWHGCGRKDQRGWMLRDSGALWAIIQSRMGRHQMVLVREAVSLHFEFKRLTLLLFWAKNVWWEGWNGETCLETTPVFKERDDAILRGSRSSGASLVAQMVENLTRKSRQVGNKVELKTQPWFRDIRLSVPCRRHAFPSTLHSQPNRWRQRVKRISLHGFQRRNKPCGGWIRAFKALESH